MLFIFEMCGFKSTKQMSKSNGYDFFLPQFAAVLNDKKAKIRQLKDLGRCTAAMYCMLMCS